MAQIEEYLSLALMLPVATMVGLGIGYLLDGALGTRFLKVVFLVIGFAAGVVEVIRRLTHLTRDDQSR
jgi:F0F1-type ATP synthase assembly protein I